MLRRKTYSQLFATHALAFTLAEVLITLGIIGVVAAFTIPVLMNNIQDNQYKTAYKKAYSLASQALAQGVADENIVFRPSWGDAATRLANFNAFKSYFKVIKDCNSSNNSLCWAAGEYYWASYPVSSAPAFIDTSGVSWSLVSDEENKGADVLLDTNGLKKPNKYGQDRFILLMIPEASNRTNYNTSAGIPGKIITYGDYTSTENNLCPSGNVHPCYYNTWLYD